MKAYLVTATVTVRVVMPDDATGDEITEAAKPDLLEAIRTNFDDYIEAPEDDKECPYGTLERDK